MSTPLISTKPYFLRALHEWCTDNGLTPHLAVQVDSNVRVPAQYVQDGRITLNISAQATIQLVMGNDLIVFSARFSGKLFRIEVPVANVQAIYARETSEGMAFPPQTMPEPAPDTREAVAGSGSAHRPGAAPKETPAGKGFLRVIK